MAESHEPNTGIIDSETVLLVNNDLITHTEARHNKDNNAKPTHNKSEHA